MNAAECARQVGEIFALPDTCLKIKEIIDHESSSIDAIAEVISYDPILSSKLLRLANSALYSFPRQVDSVQKAVLLLGETQVYNLVIASGATEAFGALNRDVIPLEEFWQHSIHTALIAKYLAAQLGYKRDEPVYLSGLLHNIGELVIAQLQPELARICSKLNGHVAPWHKQHELLGFTFVDCSIELLRLWQLPERICLPLVQLDQPQWSEPDKLGLLLHVARCLALSEANKDKFHLFDLIDKNALTVLDLKKSDLDEASNYAFLEGMAILSLLNPALVAIF